MKQKLTPFKEANLAEQKVHYRNCLQRQFIRSKATLAEKHVDVLKEASDLLAKANYLDEKIANIEDVVANRADKTYKSWSVWRRNAKLLKKVAQEMFKASSPTRAEQAQLREKANELRRPFDLEYFALDKAFEQCKRTGL